MADREHGSKESMKDQEDTRWWGVLIDDKIENENLAAECSETQMIKSAP